MNEKFQKLGFYPADILLPKDADMTKWAVVACDQFTSQPEYWQAVEDTVGDAPSTLRLILPEAKLNDPDVDEDIADINSAMNRYLDGGRVPDPAGVPVLHRADPVRRQDPPRPHRHGGSGPVRLHPRLRRPDPGHGGDGALPYPAPGAGPAGRPHRAAPRDAADRRPGPDRHRAPDRRDGRHGEAVRLRPPAGRRPPEGLEADAGTDGRGGGRPDGPVHAGGHGEEIRPEGRGAAAVRRGRRQPLPGHRQAVL